MSDVLIKLVRSPKQLSVDKATWNALVAQNEVNEIFLTYEWVFSWLDAFWQERELFFLVLHDQGRLAGIAPLVVYDSDRRGNHILTLSFAGRRATDYNDFIIAGDKRRILWSMLDFILDAEGFDRIELIYIPENSSTLSVSERYFREKREKNASAEISSDIVCPTHILDSESKDLFERKTRRPRRKLNMIGSSEIVHLSDPDVIVPLLPQFFNQHIKRRSIYEDTAKSQFLQEAHKRFYHILARRLPGLLFSVLSLDGVHIAFHFGFVYNDKFLWYKPCFDLEYAQYSPGLVLLKGLFDYVRKNNLKELDFTIGDEQFKTRFANKTRKTMNLCIDLGRT